VGNGRIHYPRQPSVLGSVRRGAGCRDHAGLRIRRFKRAIIIGIAAGWFRFSSATRSKLVGYDDALDTFGVHAVGGTLCISYRRAGHRQSGNATSPMRALRQSDGLAKLVATAALVNRLRPSDNSGTRRCGHCHHRLHREGRGRLRQRGS